MVHRDAPLTETGRLRLARRIAGAVRGDRGEVLEAEPVELVVAVDDGARGVDPPRVSPCEDDGRGEASLRDGGGGGVEGQVAGTAVGAQPLLTGSVYAVTMLPWLIGGPLLSGRADRHPRRTVMLTCTPISGVLIAAISLPGLPLAVLVVLLFLAVLMEPPFLSARAALLTEVLPDDRYLLASTASNITGQGGQVLGFAAGGSP